MTEEKMLLIDERLDRIIAKYNNKLTELFDEKKGGKIRGAKGKLVEELAEELVHLTWEDVLQQPADECKCKKEKENIFIKDVESYIKRAGIDEKEIERILNDYNKIVYRFSADVHVKIRNDLVLAIECKSYTDTAMLKRIIADSMLMDELFPDAGKYCIFQLENAFNADRYHILMSRHTHNIDVLTLLAGERKSKEPIHERENEKELKKEKLIEAIDYFASVLEPKVQ